MVKLDKKQIVVLAVLAVALLYFSGFLFTVTATRGVGTGSCSWKVEYGLTQTELQRAGVCSSGSGSVSGTYSVNYVNPQGAVAATTGTSSISIPCSGATFGTTINRYGTDQIYNKYAYAGTWIARLRVSTPSVGFIQEAAYDVPLSCLQIPSTQVPYSTATPTPTVTASPTEIPAPALEQTSDAGVSGDASQNQTAPPDSGLPDLGNVDKKTTLVCKNAFSSSADNPLCDYSNTSIVIAAFGALGLLYLFMRRK